jgi:predicted Zn finger-like uncharacterized protein
MLIVCPNCTTSYEVDPATLGAAGRSVRCARCKRIWLAGRAPGAAARAVATAVTPPRDDAVAAFRSELGSGAARDAFEDDPIARWDAPVDATESEQPAAETAEPAAEEPAAASEEAPAPETGDPAEDSSAPAEAVAEATAEGAPDAPAPDPEAPTEPEPPAEPEPADPVSEIPAADAPPLVPVDAEPTPAEPPLDNQPGDIESVAARRTGPRRRQRPQLFKSKLPIAIVGLIGILAALVTWRGEIVRHAPQMASLYSALGLPVNLRGLAFTDVKTTKDTHDGVSVLVVEGTIVNVTSVPIEVARLRFAVRNDAGNEIYAWTAMPSQTVLPAGERLPFRSRLASPPTEARAIEVRFFTRRDAAAGGR